MKGVSWPKWLAFPLVKSVPGTCLRALRYVSSTGLSSKAFWLYFVLRQDLLYPGWPQTRYVAKEDLVLLTLWPPPLECWEHTCASSHLDYVVANIKPGFLQARQVSVPQLGYHQSLWLLFPIQSFALLWGHMATFRNYCRHFRIFSSPSVVSAPSYHYHVSILSFLKCIASGPCWKYSHCHLFC